MFNLAVRSATLPTATRKEDAACFFQGVVSATREEDAACFSSARLHEAADIEAFYGSKAGVKRSSMESAGSKFCQWSVGWMVRATWGSSGVNHRSCSAGARMFLLTFYWSV